MSNLRQAAQAVIERWDSPAWKDVPATAVYISALREALAAPEQDAAGAENSRSSSMTTPTLQDRVIAYKCFELPGQPMYTHTGTSRLISDLYIAVEAITKERDEYQQAADTMAAAHKVERDKHCNCEFEGDENTVQCTLHNAWAETLHEQAGFRRERDALMSSAKLALAALESLFGVPAEFTSVGGGAVAVWRLGGSDAPRRAITALREAGVK